MRWIIAIIPIIIITLIVTLPPISGQAPPTHTWWVDSDRGSDTRGTGTDAQPFKTITHALSRASGGDTVKVRAASPYDSANGERFPILMKRNVKIIGISTSVIDARTRPVIKGGADYAIPSSSRYVSVLGANGALISGFLFQAVNSGSGRDDGTSILCNATSPTIHDNQFTSSGNAHAGITTMGTAHPAIQNNEFGGTSLAWGITAYEESYPQIEGNKFSGRNGIDCTASSRPVIRNNLVSTQGAGISTKGSATATIIGNVIRRNRDYGVIVRMDSTPAIQDNLIKDNPVGIFIGEGNPVPDIGGGGRSLGNNTFENTVWDVENHSNAPISAKNNHWPNNCCEDIDAKIYDNEENLHSGDIDVGMCIICRARAPLSRPGSSG